MRCEPETPEWKIEERAQRERARAKAPELLECLSALLEEVANASPSVATVAKGCALIAEIEGGE